MQRLEQRSPDAILLLFLIAQTVDITMPVFALLALVAYSVSLALIVPGLLQKNGGWRRMAIISAVIALVCHAIALEARILPDGDSGQNLSLLNVGSLVSLMICTVMTIVASRNRGWLLLPIVYAFALINPRWRPSCPMNTSPIWKQRRDAGAHWLIALFLCHANYRRPVRAATGVD